MALRLLDLQLIYGVAGARERFEQLCKDLISAEFSGAKAVRCAPGDGGVDIYIGDWADPAGISVYQVKYFPIGLGASQKNQVYRSFRTCIENSHFAVKRWTLCLPVDLNEEETAWFTKWKYHRATDFLVADRIDWWGESSFRQFLLQPKNIGIKEAYFHQEHVAQIREMYRMLTHLLEDFATRPEESVMALALRQDAKEANLRYRDEVYGPLHTELKGIRDGMERARAGSGPYPTWIPVRGEQLPRHLRYTPPASVGPTFQLWPAFKEAFRLYGAFTTPAYDRLDEIEAAVTAYNHAIEEARETAVPLLRPHVAQALEAETKIPAYLEWKGAYKDAPTPPPYQSFPWFELIERITSSTSSPPGEETATYWLRRPLQTFGWLLADRPDQAGQCVFDEYERSTVMPRSVAWFQDIFSQAMPDLKSATPFRQARQAQEHLYRLVSAMETALLNVLINIQHEYEGGPPPF
jgi:hypothetical protein